MDIMRGEAVESDLDGLITKRHGQRMSEEQGRIEDGWAESVRVFNARRQRELCWAWLRWHQRMLNSHTRTAALITAHHRSEIERYERLLNIDYQGGDAA